MASSKCAWCDSQSHHYLSANDIRRDLLLFLSKDDIGWKQSFTIMREDLAACTSLFWAPRWSYCRASDLAFSFQRKKSHTKSYTLYLTRYSSRLKRLEISACTFYQASAAGENLYSRPSEYRTNHPGCCSMERAQELWSHDSVRKSWFLHYEETEVNVILTHRTNSCLIQ